MTAIYHIATSLAQESTLIEDRYSEKNNNKKAVHRTSLRPVENALG